VPAEPTTKTHNKALNHANIGQGNKGENGRVLPRELLDNGQGKSATTSDDDREDDINTAKGSTASNSDMDISSTESTRDLGEHKPDQIDIDNTKDNNLLHPPIINATGEIATGATMPQLQKQNKLHRQETLLTQPVTFQWHRHQGSTLLDDDHTDKCEKTSAESEMAPQGRALQHEAAPILKDWEQFGCPTATGKDWTTAQIQAGIDRGPHKSALEPDALKHFAAEVADKVAKGHACVVLWDDNTHNHPKQLKIIPVAAIPHKSRAYRSILDLSFTLRLDDEGTVPSVNDTTQKLAPQGAIGQLGHSLKRIIHAFAEADDDAVILMAKWDIQDGFWRLNCRDGEVLNFCYVWPQEPGEPTCLILPNSLQMGWVNSEPYFCAASKTARDVAVDYIETKVGALPTHKFSHWAGADKAPVSALTGHGGRLCYLVEVYVDNFITCIILTTKQQVEHVAQGILHGIHDVFPPSEDNSTDPILNKKLRIGEGTFETSKCLLGFEFNGVEKTISKTQNGRPSCRSYTNGSAGR